MKLYVKEDLKMLNYAWLYKVGLIKAGIFLKAVDDTYHSFEGVVK